MTTAGLSLGAILANVTAVYAAGPIGWVVFYFTTLILLMLVLLWRDNRKAAAHV